jgi:hypothetical protein
MKKHNIKVAKCISTHHHLVEWIENEKKESCSNFITTLLQREYDLEKNNDLDLIKEALQENIEKINEFLKRRLELIKKAKEVLKKEKGKKSEEKMKVIEGMEKQMNSKISLELIKQIEKEIKENNLQEIEKEMLNEYKKNPDMIYDENIMKKWSSKFKEKDKYFLLGNDLSLYCKHKGEHEFKKVQ